MKKKNKDIRPIRTEADYDWALKEIEPYFAREPKRGTFLTGRGSRVKLRS